MADRFVTETLAREAVRRQRNASRNQLGDAAVDDAQGRAGPDARSVSTFHRGTNDTMSGPLGAEPAIMERGGEEEAAPRPDTATGSAAMDTVSITEDVTAHPAALVTAGGDSRPAPAAPVMEGSVAAPSATRIPGGTTPTFGEETAASSSSGGDGFLATVTRAFAPGVQKIAAALGLQTASVAEPAAESIVSPAPTVPEESPAADEEASAIPGGDAGQGSGLGAVTGRDNGLADVDNPDTEHAAEMQALIDTIGDLLSSAKNDTGAAAEGTGSAAPPDATAHSDGGALPDSFLDDITDSLTGVDDEGLDAVGSDSTESASGESAAVTGDTGTDASGSTGDTGDAGQGDDIGVSTGDTATESGDTGRHDEIGSNTVSGTGASAGDTTTGSGDGDSGAAVDDSAIDTGDAETGVGAGAGVLAGGTAAGSDNAGTGDTGTSASADDATTDTGAAGTDGDTGSDTGVSPGDPATGSGADAWAGDTSRGTGDAETGGTALADVVTGTGGSDSPSGTVDDDVFDGAPGPDPLYGGRGNDSLAGGETTDRLSGGSGEDVLYGGSDGDGVSGVRDDDVLEGSSGGDRLADGDGADVFRFGEDFGRDRIRDVPVEDGDGIDRPGAGISEVPALMTGAESTPLDTVLRTDPVAETADPGATIGAIDRDESTDTFRGEVIANGPVGYWRLGEDGASNAPAIDETGTANGTWHKTPTGDRDGAFAGIPTVSTELRRDGYVTIPDDPAWQLTDGTVQFWMRSDNNRSRQGLVSRDARGDDDTGHFSVQLERNDINLRIQGPDGGTLSASNVITDHAWHQIAVTFGADGLELWVDGVLVANDPSITQGIAGNHEGWVIGADNRSSRPGTTDGLEDFFDGQIAELALFDTQLGPNAIGDLYDAGVNGTDVIRLTAGEDLFGGTADAALIGGAAGDDVISGGSGDDYLFGGDAADGLAGGAGADVPCGGDWFDTADGSASEACVTVDPGAMAAAGGRGQGDTLSGPDNLTGSACDDVLSGDAGADLSAGLGGNDAMAGGAYSDNVVSDAASGDDLAPGDTDGGCTDGIRPQTGDGPASERGWTITLTRGTVEADDGSSLTLSKGAAGTITLADGSEISFDGMERIDYGS